LRVAGNIVTGAQTDFVLVADGVQFLAKPPQKKTQISSKKKHKEAAWNLSYIVAGKTAHIQEVINNHLMFPLLDVLGVIM
jgi:hypothetical protein